MPLIERSLALPANGMLFVLMKRVGGFSNSPKTAEAADRKRIYLLTCIITSLDTVYFHIMKGDVLGNGLSDVVSCSCTVMLPKKSNQCY
jgi:hypothetical protein